jgi:hypothetical protein
MFLAQQQGIGNDIVRAVKYRQIELYMLAIRAWINSASRISTVSIKRAGPRRPD